MSQIEIMAKCKHQCSFPCLSILYTFPPLGVQYMVTDVCDTLKYNIALTNCEWSQLGTYLSFTVTRLLAGQGQAGAGLHVPGVGLVRHVVRHLIVPRSCKENKNPCSLSHSLFRVSLQTVLIRIHKSYA